MKALLLLTIVLNVVDTVYSVTGTSECPQNIRALRHLHVYSDSCLLLVRNKLTWKDARTSCRKIGGELVMIKEADKQVFILKALSTDHWDQDQVWIGATDLQHEGDWRWVDGSKVTFNRFANGQGNNHNDGFFFANGGTEDCAVLRRDDGGKWHDYHCESVIGNLGYHFTYICEFRKIPVQTTRLTTQAPAPTTTAHMETRASTTTAQRETPAPTTTVHRETTAPTTMNRETPAPTTMKRETPAPTTMNRETPAPTTMNRETPAPTTVGNRETPAPTTVGNRETPAPTTAANRETPAPTTLGNRETPAPTTAANRETPAPTTAANRETPAPTTMPQRETPRPTAVFGRRR